MITVKNALLSLLLPGLMSFQTTWYVDQAGIAPGLGTLNDPYTQIQYAIDQPTTLSGDTVRVAAGTYVENVDFAGKSLRLWAPMNAENTTIDGGGTGSAITIATGEGVGTQIDGFTITGGTGTAFDGLLRGGGVFADGSTFAILNCRIENNVAAAGAGLFANDANVTATVTTVSGNQIPYDQQHPERHGAGIALRQGSALSAVQLTVADNHGIDADGGGLALSSSTLNWTTGTLEDNSVEPNDVQVFGGGLWASSSIIDLQGVTVEHNTALFGMTGGGLVLESCAGSITLCTFELNGGGIDTLNLQDWGGYGGALYVRSSPTLTVDSSTFEENRAGWCGGAVDTDSGSFSNCTFQENLAERGGAVQGGSYTDCSFTQNQATSFSGSTHMGGAAQNATLTRCTVRFNTALGAGGGLDQCVATDCDISNNTALQSGGFSQGGGANNSTLFDCRIWGNQVAGFGGATTNQGGGIWGGSATLCAIYDNTAEEGGGAFAADLDRSTLYGNVATLLGGGFGAGTSGLHDIASTVLWNNTPEAIATNGAIALVSYSNVEGGWPGVGNLSSDPMFWLAQAKDFHLQPGSVCIDAGDPSQLDADGTPIEIGALPFDADWAPEPTLYCVSTPTSGGCLPMMGSSGAPSASNAQAFSVDAFGLPANVPGLLFYGLAGPAALPFQGGTLCVAPPLRRTIVQTSRGNGACGGSYDFDVNAWIQGATDPGLTFGAIVNAQYWFRDNGAPSGAGLTNGLAFAVGN